MMQSFSDTQGRHISYLRVSVTDRCDMRCVYCMSEDMVFLPRDDVLSFEEMERLCGVFIRSGVRRMRITGGEPLVRRDVLGFFTSLGTWLGRPAGQPGLDELTLTTNGSLLAEYADGLRRAGVRRVNVSLDSLDPARFAAVTRRGKLDKTLAGVKAARAAGLDVRINTVAMAGVNDDEFDDLIRWCGEVGTDLCLIETMPMGNVGEDRAERYLPLSRVRTDLARRWTLEPVAHRTGGPARYVRIAETGRRLGFITPMTHNFCDTCNRVRLSCTGTLYTCLGQEDQCDLRGPLRDGATDTMLTRLIADAVARKRKGHDFLIDPAVRERGPARLMSVTGG
ncbi:GTP 3',8-cyclase MoaA [Ameyamaea chiangmaiensis]|uniref:GTP 3',8-cyclase n=1 Tax=Ameyamaea chiangmaiensis TaxID=442969 RepID=A0A850PBD5_9PROT|nr:GTP 3',8-cyclase MoaA [Ameyamaea chiangmaiensis]MBS4073745.1 GTP 3',8-cyclase MoaA [Ameyamaea chiangmaiensis]NVN39989.1 GTP 3',8-cyclase MoaA [Ameyamaea chiangmaiensis]